MKDRPVSATAVAAGALWIVGGVLFTIHAFTGISTQGFGFFATAAGATLTVRVFLVEFSAAIVDRERNAFEIGRDAKNLRSMR